MTECIEKACFFQLNGSMSHNSNYESGKHWTLKVNRVKQRLWWLGLSTDFKWCSVSIYFGWGSLLYSRLPVTPPLYNSNFPLTRSNFHFPSDHFLHSFTLNNSNFFLFPLKVQIIESRMYLIHDPLTHHTYLHLHPLVVRIFLVGGGGGKARNRVEAILPLGGKVMAYGSQSLFWLIWTSL